MSTIDLRAPRRIHIVGVGGAGMSAIAAVLVWMGHEVSGSDLKASPASDRLELIGVDVRLGHAPEHVGDADLIAVSSAIPERNVEVAAARERGIPVRRRAEILAAISAQRRTIAVAGTHGKTTTASMLALALGHADLAPSFIIGGDINEIGSGAVWDDGDWFVVEADESDGTFVTLGHEVGVVTNVEPDHLEHHGSFDALRGAFARFVADAAGPVVVCLDDPGSAELANERGVVTYGEHPDAHYRLRIDEHGRDGVRGLLSRGGVDVGVIDLPIPGRHNMADAVAAAAAAIEIGADPGAVLESLARFGGVARRFERRGSVGGVTFVDDYAHLPTEVAAALAAAGDGGWERIVCVFQPHRYSRTEALWQDFDTCFSGADRVFVADVYAAGEAPRPGVSGRLIVDAIRRGGFDGPVEFVAHRAELVARLVDVLEPGDLCLTLGAGDLTTVPTEVMAGLA